MGRAKLKMELIEKEKSRNTTFKKRKEGLIRKLHEFSTLCDVNACMIIYGPNRNTEPEIFPSHDPEQVRRIIDLYNSKNNNNNNNNNTNSSIKSFGVIDFFHDRKKQIEEEVAKLRRKNLEAKYPTRPELLNALTEPQLRQLHAQLTVKVDQVKTLVDFLKGNAQAASSSITAGAMPQSHYSASAAVTDHHRDFGAEMLNDHRRMQQRLIALNHYHPMMVRHFDGGSTSANIQLKHQLFFESAGDFYGGTLPPPPQQFLLPPPPQHQRPILLPALAQPQQVQYFSNHDEEFLQYHIRNQTASRNQNENEEREQDEEKFGVNNFFSY